MVEEIEQAIKGTGLEEAILHLKAEIDRGKYVEKEIESVVVANTERVSTVDMLAAERVTSFKKGRKLAYSGYEPYSEEEIEELVERSLLTGILDTIELSESLSSFSKEYEVTLEFDDERTLGSHLSWEELGEIKKLLSEHMRREWETEQT